MKFNCLTLNSKRRASSEENLCLDGMRAEPWISGSILTVITCVITYTPSVKSQAQEYELLLL